MVAEVKEKINWDCFFDKEGSYVYSNIFQILIRIV